MKICETKKEGTGKTIIENKYSLYYSRITVGQKDKKGLGIMMIEETDTKFEVILPIIMYIKMEEKEENWRIIWRVAWNARMLLTGDCDVWEKYWKIHQTKIGK